MNDYKIERQGDHYAVTCNGRQKEKARTYLEATDLIEAFVKEDKKAEAEMDIYSEAYGTYSNIYRASYLESLTESLFADLEDISAERICEMSRIFTGRELTESAILTESVVLTEASADFNRKLEDALARFGYPLHMVQDIKFAAQEIVRIIKRDGLNKKSMGLMVSSLEDMFAGAANKFKMSETELLKFKNYDANRIKNAAMLFTIVLLINTIISTVITILFGPAIAQVALTIIIAPITEEFAKKVAITGKFIAEFTVIFNAYEAIYYVSFMRKTFNIPLKAALKLRSLTVGMHLTTTIIEFLTKNEKVQKLLKLDKKQDKDKLSFIGQVTGWLIHATWNTLSLTTKFMNKVTKFAGVSL